MEKLNEEKDKIYTEIQNIDSNITKLEDKRTNKLKQIQDCIRNEQNNAGKTKNNNNNDWYDLLDCDINDTQIITNGYDILKKIEDLYVSYENTDKEYNITIRENEENKKKLEESNNKLEKNIYSIMNKNKEITEIYDNYRNTYNNKYLCSFRQYDNTLNNCNHVNSDLYHKQKQKYCDEILDREMKEFDRKMNSSFYSYSTRNIFNNYRYNTISNW